MKSNVYAIFMALVLSISLGGFSSEAAAKKFGGGGSFGKSYSIPKSTSAAAKPNATTNTNRGLFGGGLMGGLAGGLLAGGIFAALMGGGFDGIAFGDILLFALVGFLIYKLFIAPKRQLMSNASNYGRQMHDTSGLQTSNSSFFAQRPTLQLPPNFNTEAFLTEAENHYVVLQKAWDENDFVQIADYVSPEILALLQTERAKLGEDKPNTEVMSLSVDLVRGEIFDDLASISLAFSARVNEGSQMSDTVEFWHLEKDMSLQNANWVIVGIQQDN